MRTAFETLLVRILRTECVIDTHTCVCVHLHQQPVPYGFNILLFCISYTSVIKPRVSCKYCNMRSTLQKFTSALSVFQHMMRKKKLNSINIILLYQIYPLLKQEDVFQSS